MDRDRRHSFSLIASLLSTLLAGCAYISPYVPLKLPERPTTTVMPQLNNSISRLDESLRDTERLRNSVSKLQRSLNLATFGLGFSAGSASVFSAHRDTVTGLGLGAAASYTGGALFAPADQTMLYNAAIAALMCIRSRADALVSIADSVDKRRSGDLGDLYIQSTLGCVSIAADTARKSTIGALDAAVTSDQSAASSVESARLNVQNALTDELDKRAANAQAILAAAKSSVSLAVGMGSVTPSKMASGHALSFQLCSGADQDRAKALEARYKATETAITAAINDLGNLTTSCAFNVAQAPPFSAKPDAITLSAGDAMTISLSGGRVPYRTPFWRDPAPAGITARLVGADTVLVSAGATAKSGVPYTLVVMDGSTIPVEKDITVNVK